MIITRAKLKLLQFIWKLKGVKASQNTVIHQGNEIVNASNLVLGKDSIIYKNCTIYIGKKGSFSIGDGSHIAPFGYFLIDNNNLSIANDVAIGPFCSFFCHSNDIKGDSEKYKSNYVDLPINIGSNVFIGSHCVILPGSTILDNSVIAANSVVSGVVEANSLYGGSPAKKIKEL